jgi:hypothetical protein
MATTTLHQQEAVLLAHALVARLADDAGARVLFIKGPTAVALGVRPDRPSTDVDALADRTGFVALCTALEGCGWQRRNAGTGLRHAADLAFEHSAHFIHPEWPCDLDVHFSFPGFLAPEAEVFESLWAARTTVEIAGRQVSSPSVPGQALVVALHALRDPDKGTSQEDLATLGAAVPTWPPDTLTQLADLAVATGASDSASPFLEEVGAAVATSDRRYAARLADWRARQQGFGRSTMWLVELRRSPWKDKPGTLLRAILPPREYLVGSHLAADLGRGRLMLLHLQRWGRALASMPRALRRAARLR